MKYVILTSAILLSACATMSPERLEEKHAEDRANHLAYLQSIYDAEYVDDCLYYEDLICEFEE